MPELFTSLFNDKIDDQIMKKWSPHPRKSVYFWPHNWNHIGRVPIWKDNCTSENKWSVTVLTCTDDTLHLSCLIIWLNEPITIILGMPGYEKKVIFDQYKITICVRSIIINTFQFKNWINRSPILVSTLRYEKRQSWKIRNYNQIRYIIIVALKKRISENVVWHMKIWKEVFLI